MEIQALMERRVMGNCHARCGPGENETAENSV